MKKVLIPNATSHRNIGDLVMLTVLIDILKKSYKDVHVTVHSNEPELHDSNVANSMNSTFYYWAVLSTKDNITRIFRMLILITYYLLYRLGLRGTYGKLKVNEIIRDYKDADLIVYVGGGYLRTQKGLTQALNLVMQLYMFEFSRFYKCKKIVSPISFGPFAYQWQAKVAALVLNRMDLVSVRERFSYDKLKSLGLKNLILASDHALLIKGINKQNNKDKSDHGKFVLGFTIRNWLSRDQQRDFEKEYASALINFYRNYHVAIQPILQVDAPIYKIEDDRSATLRIINLMRESGVKYKKLKIVEGIKSANIIYSSIDMLLGMRMHSNILAAINGKPFVAISYEYKTKGIAKYLGMEKNCLPVEKVTEEGLYALLKDAFINYSVNKRTVILNIQRIRDNEIGFWVKYFKAAV